MDQISRPRKMMRMTGTTKFYDNAFPSENAAACLRNLRVFVCRVSTVLYDMCVYQLFWPSRMRQLDWLDFGVFLAGSGWEISVMAKVWTKKIRLFTNLVIHPGGAVETCHASSESTAVVCSRGKKMRHGPFAAFTGPVKIDDGVCPALLLSSALFRPVKRKHSVLRFWSDYISGEGWLPGRSRIGIPAYATETFNASSLAKSV